MSLLLSQGAALLSAMYIARKLGPSVTGLYSMSFAIVTMGLALASFGTDPVLTREIAKDRKSTGRLLLSSLMLKLPACLVIYLVLVFLLRFDHGVTSDQRAMMIVVWLTLFTGAVELACRAVYSGLERQEITSAIMTVAASLRAGFTILVVYMGLRLVHMGTVVVVVGVAGTSFLMWILSRHANLEWKPDLTAAKALAVTGAPFLVMDVFLRVVDRFDYVYLKMMVAKDQLGFYTSAYKLQDVVLIAALAADNALFPIIARRCEAGGAGLRKTWELMHKFLAISAVPIAVIFTLLADQIILSFYGPKFAGAGAVLRIVIWAAILFFPMIPSYRILISRDGQLRLTPLFVVRAVINVVLNILLVPRIGIIGSAITMVVMEAVHFVLCFSFPFRSVERYPIARWYLRPALAGIPMALFIWLLRDYYHVLLVAPASMLIYMISLIAVKTFDQSDFQLIRGALRSKSAAPDEAEGEPPTVP